MPKTKKSIVKPEKDILASTVEDIRKEFLKAVEKDTDLLTIDLDGVSVVDSAGLGILFAAHNSIKEKGGSVSIINASEDLLNFFDAMRLNRYFEFHTE